MEKWFRGRKYTPFQIFSTSGFGLLITSYTFGRICRIEQKNKKERKQTVDEPLHHKVNNGVSQRLETFSERVFPQWRGSDIVSISLLCLSV